MTSRNQEEFLSTDRFTWCPKERLFVAEASDLQLPGVPQQIYVKSAKTGAIRRFNLQQVAKNEEREILYWIYQGINNIQLQILND